jgi:hypothetical protein
MEATKAAAEATSKQADAPEQKRPRRVISVEQHLGLAGQTGRRASSGEAVSDDKGAPGAERVPSWAQISYEGARGAEDWLREAIRKSASGSGELWLHPTTKVPITATGTRCIKYGRPVQDTLERLAQNEYYAIYKQKYPRLAQEHEEHLTAKRLAISANAEASKVEARASRLKGKQRMLGQKQALGGEAKGAEGAPGSQRLKIEPSSDDEAESAATRLAAWANQEGSPTTAPLQSYRQSTTKQRVTMLLSAAAAKPIGGSQPGSAPDTEEDAAPSFDGASPTRSRKEASVPSSADDMEGVTSDEAKQEGAGRGPTPAMRTRTPCHCPNDHHLGPLTCFAERRSCGTCAAVCTSVHSCAVCRFEECSPCFQSCMKKAWAAPGATQPHSLRPIGNLDDHELDILERVHQLLLYPALRTAGAYRGAGPAELNAWRPISSDNPFVLEVGVPALLARIDAACVIHEIHPAARPFFLEGAEVHGLTDAAAMADATPPQLAACFRGAKAPHLVQMKFMNALFPAMEPARMVASDPLHLGGSIMLGGELATVNAPVEMHPLHRRSSELTEASGATSATISSYRLVRMKIVPLKVYRGFGLLAKGHAAVRADKALEISTAFPLATLTTMAVGVLQAIKGRGDIHTIFFVCVAGLSRSTCVFAIVVVALGMVDDLKSAELLARDHHSSAKVVILWRDELDSLLVAVARRLQGLEVRTSGSRCRRPGAINPETAIAVEEILAGVRGEGWLVRASRICFDRQLLQRTRSEGDDRRTTTRRRTRAPA